jgi:hypothetical protein
MEHLFSPCTSFLDLLEYEDQLKEEFRGRPELLQKLNMDVSINKFLDAERGFTYSDLHALPVDEYTVLWLTPHAAVGGRPNESVFRYAVAFESA